MKNSLFFLFLFAATILCSLALPWWVIAPLAIGFAYATKSSGVVGFTVPFMAIFLAWLLSIYFIDNGSVQNILGELFGMPAFMTPLIASLLGGLVAGIFGWAGSLLSPKPNRG
ncbi:MAG: hypothetical protein QMC70_02300 [Bacteroidia bacterium]